MRVILSAAVSADGYLDDASPQRLILSSPEDYDDVRALRRACDAILIGAETLRRDNPALAESGLKVVLTRSGAVPANARIFESGNTLVFAPAAQVGALTKTLGDRAGVAAFATLPALLTELGTRGVKTLLVEGGASVLTQFLAEGLADELRLAVAPFFVGDEKAPRFVLPANFPHDKGRRMTLLDVKKRGDMAVLHYGLERGA